MGKTDGEYVNKLNITRIYIDINIAINRIQMKKLKDVSHISNALVIITVSKIPCYT